MDVPAYINMRSFTLKVNCDYGKIFFALGDF